MSPRPRPLRRSTLVVALWCGVLAVSGCGSPTDSTAASTTTTTVRSEPVTGRQDGAEPSGRPPPTTLAQPQPTTPQATSPRQSQPTGETAVLTGAQVLVDGGMTPLIGRRVGLITNRASLVGDETLIDLLAANPDVDLVALFAPEHGVEAAAEAGTTVLDGVDRATGLPVQSLFDDDRAPEADALAGLDVMVFDLQDAGARFYTYVSTLGLAMQASARAGVPLLVLDRPNPLGGDRPDGPVLAAEQLSFIGLYPIPALPGLTIGELAMAIQGQGWLDGVEELELDVVGLEGWHRGDRWADTGLSWAPPSPGLPTAELALLYPATVLLEATTVSFGRGTDRPFGRFGAPWLDAAALVDRLEADGLAGVAFETIEFTDEAGVVLPGVELVVTDATTIRPMAVGVHVLHHLLAQAGDRTIIDRPRHLDLLAGTPALRRDLVGGLGPAAIVDSWAGELADWEAIRALYLLYPDG